MTCPIEKCLSAIRDGDVRNLHREDFEYALEELTKRERRPGELKGRALERVLATEEGKALYKAARAAPVRRVVPMPEPESARGDVRKCLAAVQAGSVHRLTKRDFEAAIGELVKAERKAGEIRGRALERVLKTGEGKALYYGYTYAPSDLPPAA